MLARPILFSPVLLIGLLMAPAVFGQGAFGQSASVKGPGDPTFRLINGGEKAISEVYATPAGRNNWGKNRLDKDTLAPQGAHVFKLPADGNCLYDIRVVFIDGKSRQQKGTNLCKLSDMPVK